MIPNFIVAIYSLSPSNKIDANLVASPKQIGNNPLANGSNVPVCPAFFARKICFIFCKILLLEIPIGLLNKSTPDISCFIILLIIFKNLLL